MTKTEFIKKLLDLLDSAPYNWDLLEDAWTDKLTVEDLIAQIIYYNQDLEI